MANENIFKSLAGRLVPAANAVNEAGGPAYRLSPKQALAQYAATRCFSRTFYAQADDQLQQVLALCSQVEPDFIAKTAVFCRERAFMKERAGAALRGVVGERSATPAHGVRSRNQRRQDAAQLRADRALGYRRSEVARLVSCNETRADEVLFRASVGQSPSLADVIKMVHPKPVSASRAALYGYLVDRKYDAIALPELVQQFEARREKRKRFLTCRSRC